MERYDDYDWAGLTCSGDATLILEGTNFVRGFYRHHPGIYVPEGKTLTISGDGALTAISNGKSAGIGGGHWLSCGNIVIEGGSISAIGGEKAAGIGSGWGGRCGNITIKDTVTKVAAAKGSGAPYSIGAGSEGTCDTVTIFGKEGAISKDYYAYYSNTATIDVNITSLEGKDQVDAIVFWGRKSLGLNSDGSHKLSNWERIRCWIDPDADTLHFSYAPDLLENTDGEPEDKHSFSILQQYVEFGFEFDTTNAASWPYSDAFWRAADTVREQPRKIDIEFSSRTPSISIYVNGSQLNNIKLRKGYASKVSSSKGGGPSPDNPGAKYYHFRNGWEKIVVRIVDGGNYIDNSSLYGRKIVGTNSDGSNKMGPWCKLVDANDSDHKAVGEGVTPLKKDKWDQHVDFAISREYVEFGYEFDITAGTYFPYSDVFWRASDGEVNKIYLREGGYSLNASILIEINDNEIVNESNCSSKVQYYWKTEDKIRVKTWKTGAYSNNVTRLYARKSSGAKWDVLLNETNGDHQIHIDPDYKEFGFEFDIQAGTNWPYSNVFWNAEIAAKYDVGEVEYIYIEMNGTVRFAEIYIYVNRVKVVSEDYIYGHSQYDWQSDGGINGVMVTIDYATAYITKECNFYARKAGGNWEKKYKKGDPDTFFVPAEYVEFGFEFDISGGTNWPYSQPFWLIKADPNITSKNVHIKPDTLVEKIKIEMGGTVRYSKIWIYVNGQQIHYDDWMWSQSQYKW